MSDQRAGPGLTTSVIALARPFGAVAVICMVCCAVIRRTAMVSTMNRGETEVDLPVH
jgi:hypothetical protein